MGRLILHIGYGKTGTTAVQGWLSRNQTRLAEKGILDCGTSLQSEALGDPFAPRVPQLNALLNSDLEGTTQRIADNLLRVADQYQAVVWSSEFLLHRPELISGLAALLRDRFEIEIVIYLRGHVDWLLSAYAQWAIKHRSASRESYVVPFDHFVAMRVGELDYVRMLDSWSSIDGATLNARSYDAVGDIVADFTSVLGVDATDFPEDPRRSNENLGRAQLALLKVIQENTDSNVDYQRFATMLARAGAARPDIHPVDPTPIPVSHEKLEQIHDGFDRQRRMLRRNHGVELASGFKRNRNAQVEHSDPTNTDLISMLGMVCYNLSNKVEALEEKVRKLSE